MNHEWYAYLGKKKLTRLEKALLTFIIYHFSSIILYAQPLPVGRFLTDTIEIGKPFRYALTYRHAPSAEVLFPDTARHFAPYRVQDVAVFATETTGEGPKAVSRDSAVYTLISFEIDSIQRLQVPVRVVNVQDCTALMAPADTVFLRSKLPIASADSTALQAFTLATATRLAPLRQQFNYPILVMGLLVVGLSGLLLYGLFGRVINRQWRLYQLNRQHLRFLRNYNRLSRDINPVTASETANHAVVMWKTYLEQLERRPYASLTTPEIAEQVSDDRVTNALREADQMIYGGVYSAQSLPALRVLSDVATQAYRRQRTRLQSAQPVSMPSQPDPVEPPTIN